MNYDFGVAKSIIDIKIVAPVTACKKVVMWYMIEKYVLYVFFVFDFTYNLSVATSLHAVMISNNAQITIKTNG